MSLKNCSVLRDSLLKSVRLIRKQRQCPTVERILKSLRFHQQIHNLEREFVIKQLDEVAESGALLKTDKDGQLSYKEPLKNGSSHHRGPGVKKSDMFDAVQQVITKFGGGQGLTLKAICENVKSLDAYSNFNSVILKYSIRMCCMKAMKKGSLVKSGSLFKLGCGKSQKKPGRRKCSEDLPSPVIDHAVSDEKRPATPIPICSLCLDLDKKIATGENEELICCVECGRCGHPSCLKFSDTLTETVKRMKWQCIECKKCSICAESSRENSMLFCDICDRGFHMDCCNPPIMKRPKGTWICCICELEKMRKNINSGESGFARKKIGNPLLLKKKGFKNHILSETNFSGSLSKGKRRNSLTLSSNDSFSDVSELEDFDDGMTELEAVTAEDREWYTTVQSKVKEKLFNSCDNDPKNVEPNNIESSNVEPSKTSPPLIEIGKYLVTTWYSSPFPHGFSRLPKLFLCEFCLMYVESSFILNQHMLKCKLRRPPGNEIYRKNDLSVFEVDGNIAKVFCQNLCLLAKLFLDHKTLYHDVDLFLFYVLTKNDAEGCHLVGYFSKEKYCQQKYNLSCIMTLPQYQRCGYGHFLIDFSYLLSRMEGTTGSPEKPLSDLGQLSYQSYWASALMEHLDKNQNQAVTIKGISESTGMSHQDIVSTLLSLKCLVNTDQDRFQLVIDTKLLEEHRSRLERRSQKGITLDEGRLRWTPFVSSGMVELEERQAEQQLQQVSMLVDDIKEQRQQIEALTPEKGLSRSRTYLRCRSPTTGFSTTGFSRQQVLLENSPHANKLKIPSPDLHWSIANDVSSPLEASTPLVLRRNFYSPNKTPMKSPEVDKRTSTSQFPIPNSTLFNDSLNPLEFESTQTSKRSRGRPRKFPKRNKNVQKQNISQNDPENTTSMSSTVLTDATARYDVESTNATKLYDLVDENEERDDVDSKMLTKLCSDDAINEIDEKEINSYENMMPTNEIIKQNAAEDIKLFEKELNDEETKISDIEKKISEEEKKISEEEKKISEEEKKISDEEKNISDEEKKISDEEKKISDEEKKISDEEKKISDEEKKISDEEKNISDEEKNISDEATDVEEDMRIDKSVEGQEGQIETSETGTEDLKMEEVSRLEERMEFSDTESKEMENVVGELNKNGGMKMVKIRNGK